jgi:hypothetical protein
MPPRPLLPISLALAVGACATPLAPLPPNASEAQVRGPVYETAPPMNRTVETRLRPQVTALLERLMVEGRDMKIDGVPVFSGTDRFLPGKIALGMAYLITETPADDPRLERYLAANRRLADLTLQDPNDSWGLYYYALSLHQLKQAGLLERAVSPATLAVLKQRLDWRAFVREGDLTLINLPNNYYGVAFSLARLRFMLGWEDASASERLLARTLDHYRTYSEFGFADETDGQGRFDRYSVLLIGEIAQRFIEAGLTPPPEVRRWLRNSVDLLLPRLNTRGEGFEYGRSIGAYGETAFLEVLSAAAHLGVLTPEESRLAYAFSSRVSARHMDFWVDPRTGSVNLWDGGRRTDAYRGKHRILGENLSLARQHVYTNAIWNGLGYKDAAPDLAFTQKLKRLPPVTVTWFARGEYDRALVTRRDLGRVIGLPLINGGAGQHMNNPYYPAPFSPGMLSGAPDASYPHLLPRFVLKDGASLAPLSYFRDVQVATRGRATTVTYRQSEMDRLGAPAPAKDARLAVSTTYVLEPGRITRTDRYTPAAPLPLEGIELEFGSFSSGGTASGGDVRFAEGAVRSFSVTGLDGCRVEPVARDPYRTPTGPLASRVACSAGPRVLSEPLTISWTLTYAAEAEAGR